MVLLLVVVGRTYIQIKWLDFKKLNKMKKLIGKKGKERWYPKYAPHIILGSNISILDTYYNKHKK